jgi:hypothetical protein
MDGERALRWWREHKAAVMFLAAECAEYEPAKKGGE